MMGYGGEGEREKEKTRKNSGGVVEMIYKCDI